MRVAAWRITSIRARLTLWNVAALALILLGLGAALRWSVERNLIASVDSDLRLRIARHQEFWQNPPPEFRVYGPVNTKAMGGASWLPDRGGPPGPPPQGAQPDGQDKGKQGVQSGRAPGPPRQGGAFAGPGPWRRGGRRPQWTERASEAGYDLAGRAMFPMGAGKAWLRSGFDRAAKGKQTIATIRRQGTEVRVAYAPLKRDGIVLAVVQVAYSLGDVGLAVANLSRTLLMLAPVGLLIAALGGLLLTGRMLRPLRRLTAEAASMGADDLSRRLPVAGRDEFATLAETVNDMLGRIEHAFEQQRRFTADASHELRTPLTVIKANAGLALADETLPAEHRRSVASIDRAAGRMHQTIQDLLLLARSDAGELTPSLRPTRLAGTLEDAAECAFPHGDARLRLECGDLMVMGDAGHLTRLFTNLLDNAGRHTPPGGRITADARREGGKVVVTLRDTGAGIDAEHLPHVCERFYRVDKARARQHGGTGLGLAICRSIVQAHGGSMRLESRPGEGVTVTVELQAA
jgi:heavy metal sensor kinase